MVVNRELPRVALIGTGGTMASLGTSSLDMMDYPEYGSKISPKEILNRVPETAQVAQVQTVAFRSVGSTALTTQDWLDLRACVLKLAHEDSELAGIVIIHGTATLEETAFFLDLTLDIQPTVVLVGAQKPISAVGSDAAGNLIGGLRVAVDQASRNRGVLVVLNDEIHAARDVVKMSTVRLQAFRSQDYGVLGIVDPDGVHFIRRVERPIMLQGKFSDIPYDMKMPRIDIVYSYAGADDVQIRAALAAGARGIICAGLAPGIAARGELPALRDAIQAGVEVVQASRSASGRVAARRFLLENGFLPSADFSPQKARILLGLGLASDLDHGALLELFMYG